MQLTRHRKGFTLLEMVVTMSIISIMSLIAIPSFLTVLQNAQRQAALSQGQAVLTTVDADVISRGAATPDCADYKDAILHQLAEPDGTLTGCTGTDVTNTTGLSVDDAFPATSAWAVVRSVDGVEYPGTAIVHRTSKDEVIINRVGYPGGVSTHWVGTCEHYSMTQILVVASASPCV